MCGLDVSLCPSCQEFQLGMAALEVGRLVRKLVQSRADVMEFGPSSRQGVDAGYILRIKLQWFADGLNMGRAKEKNQW